MNPFKGEHRLECGEHSFLIRLTLHDVAVVEAHFHASFHVLLHRYLAGEMRRVDVVWLLSQLLPEEAFHTVMEQDARLLAADAFTVGVKQVLLEGVLHLQPEPFDFVPHLRAAVAEWRMVPAHFWALSPREWRNLCMMEADWMTVLAQDIEKWQGGAYAA